MSLFTARRHARAVYAVIMCLSVFSSICPSICLSVNASDSVFFDAKNVGEIPTGSPPTGCQIEVG